MIDFSRNHFELFGLPARFQCDEASLDRWAARIRAWSQGGEPADAHRISTKPAPKRRSRDVYCYFDNDIKVHAPFDARRLAQKLDLPVSSEPALPPEIAVT